ncbi:glycosyltransferase [Epibacterium ulvae]|uniref:rhamnan synthesis F family protein n=1 Tax=Epibacterium ulvae TaxID=1156985 RepID=UPI001BFCA007|nr:rhamnan synthesis F family protein [Epibacterium ulvae]MBT8155108.1 glycosyltransferase [Epibacterium ulvae]
MSKTKALAFGWGFLLHFDLRPSLLHFALKNVSRTKMMTPLSVNDITIVTVSYNSSPILPDMLNSVPKDSRVIVVNNGGSDTGALETLSAQFGFQLVNSEKNLGFGGGCNLGVESATSEFVLLLNPDSQLCDGTLEILLSASAKYGTNTAFGPRIESPDGSADFKRRSVLLPKSDWLPRGCPKEECEVPVLTGSAIFARRKLFHDIPFDPEIFMYHEDDDWSLSVRKQGKLIFIPAARVRHQAGHASGRDPLITRFKAFQLAQSRIYAMEKHERPHPRLHTTLKAFLGLLSPENLFSARRRAKSFGFYEGARKSAKKYTSPWDMPVSWRNIPLWKLKRELIRPFKQLKELVPRNASYFLAQPYYDLVLARQKQITDGDVRFEKKVAIYLIFPKSGLLASHKVALEYLKKEGYAPIVVSNVELSDADRQTLTKLSYKVIERPNFGYDFGGYRDGVLLARETLPSVDKLVILNDSSWFPLPGSSNWLKEAEALNLDFVGAATNYGHPRATPERYRSLRWSYTSSHKNFHYCSFGLLISGKMFKDPRFLKFWKSFPLTNDKTVTVRRGEIGFTKWVIANGFSHGTTLELAELDKKLSSLDCDALREVARNTIIPAAPKLDALKKELLGKNASKDELVNLVLTIVAGQGVSYTMTRFMHDENGFAFLKKSPVWLSKEASDLTLQFARDLEGPFSDVILEEALDQRRQRASEFDA